MVGGHCGSGKETAGDVVCCTRGLGLGYDATCRRWGSPTPTKVKNLLPPATASPVVRGDCVEAERGG